MERTHPANIFVCECITQALFRLMKRKPYHEITVTDIVREAGVSRNSFYRNYQNIQEIITQFLEQKTSEWWNEFITCPDRHHHVISEMFRHFLNMKEEIDLLYHAGLSYLLMEHIIRCGKLNQTGEIKNTYQTAFMSGGLCGIVNEWIVQGMKESPEKMEQFFQNNKNTFGGKQVNEKNRDGVPNNYSYHNCRDCCWSSCVYFVRTAQRLSLIHI